MRKIKILAAVCFFLACVAGGAFAQVGMKEFPQGKWWTKRPVIRELGLSLQQQTRIESIWVQRFQALMGQQAELQKRQQMLSGLLAQDIIDVTSAMRVFDEVQQIRHNLERSTFLMRIMIKNTLSPEQQRKLEEIAERLRQQRESEETSAKKNGRY